MKPGVKLETLSWMEAEQWFVNNPVVVIPLGAAGTGTITPTVDPETLDDTATTPQVTKEANAEVGQIGGTVVWTITVRNSWTQIMSNVSVQDNVPKSLSVVSAITDRGASVLDGQLISVTTGPMNPGDVVTVTVTTEVLSSVGSPGTVTNTACAMQVGGDAQDCNSATVNLGPDVGGLPATGMATPTEHSSSALPVGMLSLGLAVGLLALMGAASPNRRALMAVLFVVLALAIIAVAVVVAVMGGDDDEPSDAADALLQRGMRLDESTPGHGIGLAVVKDIAHSYGGRLSIQASDLGGAEFMVSIPPVSTAKGD